MMKRKKLGREYMNTCIIQFRKKVNPHKLLTTLHKLDMIDNDDMMSLWGMKEMSVNDQSFMELHRIMDDIAPEGCSFKVKNSYRKVQGGPGLDKYTTIGFYS